MPHFDINRPAPKHNPFSVPEGYYNQFTRKMIQRIQKNAPLISPPSFKAEGTAKNYRQVAAERHNLAIVKWLPMLGAACVATLMVLFSQVVSLTDPHMLQPTSAATAESETATYEDVAYDYLIISNSETLASYASDY